MFEREHPFVREVLETFVQNYDGIIWAKNGPSLVTNVWKEWNKTHTSNDKHAMKPYNYTFFYMIHYDRVRENCFETVSGETFDSNMKMFHTVAYGLHINAKLTGDVGIGRKKIKKGTLCSYLLNEYCVLCDVIY